MAQCIRCGSTSLLISAPLEVCASCIKNHHHDVQNHIEKIHSRIRKIFGLPGTPPRDEDGLLCTNCINSCRIPLNGRGYCGVRINKEGRFVGGGKSGNFSSYNDPLPTNCVADWICPGGSDCGYPEYSVKPEAETGYQNLAVFFKSCTFNCLFCQNWSYRIESTRPTQSGPQLLADQIEDRTNCVCFFGGDPASQLSFAIAASYLAREKKKGEILRICWETNGSMHPTPLSQAAELSLDSGGCIKFDLKAWDDKLHYALTGVSNSLSLKNFRMLAEFSGSRANPPFLVASTLLIPGYVDEDEVHEIAGFIASLDPNIPYSLLGYAPQFYMQDLPATSRAHAERCRNAARAAGLKRIRLGNTHLLDEIFY